MQVDFEGIVAFPIITLLHIVMAFIGKCRRAGIEPDYIRVSESAVSSPHSGGCPSTMRVLNPVEMQEPSVDVCPIG